MGDEARGGGGGIVDKRQVVRVGLPQNRSSNLISSIIKAPSQAVTAPIVDGRQYIKLPMNQASNVITSVGGGSGGGGLGGGMCDEDSETARRRELMSRHPSYRKLYNELTSTNQAPMGYKLEEDSSDGQITQDSNDNSDDPALGHTYQILSQEDGADDEALQSITLKNLTSGGGVSSSGATIVQYTQGPDGQLFIPVHQLNSSGLIFPPGLMMSGNVSGLSPQMGNIEESCKKRELRLLKNKEAAKECRRKKKEYVKCLENRVAVLENQNKTLIEELKSLKELYCQKDMHS